MALETLTTYTENDPSSVVTVAANQITVTAARKDAEYQVYKDKGAGHFSGDFTHTVALRYTQWGTYGPSGFCWALANEIVTANLNMSYPVLFAGGFNWHYTSSKRLVLGETGAEWDSEAEEWNLVFYWDYYGNISLNTWYYFTLERDETVGTYGTLYGRIYSDADRTNLVDTLVLALHAKEDFRYAYAAEAGWWQDLGSATYTAEFADLDVGDAGTPEPEPPAGRIGALLGVGLIGL